jgi:hypothetical protein
VRQLTLLFSLLIFFSLIGCEKSEPEYLIEEDTYILMFAELAIIDQYDPNLLKNRTKEEVREMVYQKYNVSKEDFRRSHKYYEENIDAQLKRLGKVNLILKEERDEVNILERQLKDKNKLSADSLRQRLNIE